MEQFKMDEYGDIDSQGMVHLPFTQIWGNYLPKLEYRHVLRESSRFQCPHTVDGEVERVLILIHENGLGSEGICLDCLMDWVERNRSRMWED